ncbi:hypothetical protein G7Y89_g844 [Cudoniella acicularis]|uniref:NAD(P)-binding protein n=1 Tax=Cudoniella acicularis TaxID=354080 RepID=A0A8H4RYC8_9HELO|nr:hypothetical protein G7Y89_g844 [Cudoniella acicularis]
MKEHYQTYPRISPTHLRSEITSKTVLITGGGYGIGASIANSFAQAGAHSIILAGRTESRLLSTISSLSASFPATKFTHHVLDITSKASVKKLFDELKTSPDILVNNAGYLPEPKNFLDIDLEEFWKGFEVNVFGTALVTQSFLRHRRDALSTATTTTPQEPAVVITLNTIAAYAARAPSLNAYCASKAASLRWNELLSEDIPPLRRAVHQCASRGCGERDVYKVGAGWHVHGY